MERIAVLHDRDLDEFLTMMAERQIYKSGIWEIEFWVDTDGLKFKVNGGVWGPPFGTVEERP